MRDSSVVQIDLSAIDHNLRVLRRIVGPEVGLCPIVKADAYGLGAARLAKRLVAGGATMLAVYSPEQATELVRAAVGAPILVLMPIWEIDRTDELYRAMVAGRLHLTIHGLRHIEGVIQIAERFGATIPVHVEVDTGMTRGGVSAEEASPVLRRIASNRWVRLAGLFTHFASSEAAQGPTDAQLRRFHDFVNAHESYIPGDCIIHAANTCAAIRHPRYHCGMVRIGLAWTGYGIETLEGGDVIAEAAELQPAVTWSSQIAHLRTVEPGTTVGYGSRWHARRTTRIALVPVGYADGYPISCAGADGDDEYAMVGVLMETSSGLRRAMAPVVGAVSMDQITIDVTDLPENLVATGTTVELISPDPQAANHLTRVAQRAGTLPHEVLCRLNPRLRRVYLSRGALIETKPAAAIAV